MMMKVQFDSNFINTLKYIHEIKIFNEIQNQSKILIFDFRKRSEYEARHLDLSINIPYDESDTDFFETFCESKIKLLCENFTHSDCVRQRIKSYKRYFIALIMSEEKIKRKQIENVLSDEGEEEKREAIQKVMLFYKALIIKGVREIGLYNGGMKKVAENYEFMLWHGIEKPLAK
jgi:hypothetical protein